MFRLSQIGETHQSEPAIYNGVEPLNLKRNTFREDYPIAERTYAEEMGEDELLEEEEDGPDTGRFE